MDAFAEWYNTFPRHVGKIAALKAYKTALKLTAPEDLQGAAEAQAAIWDELTGYKSKKGKDKAEALKFCPHPATWLNQGRWDDEEIQEYLSRPKRMNIVIKESELAYLAWIEFDPTLKTFGGKIVVPTEWPPQGDEQ